jgi:predicted transposase YdaD
LIRQLLSEDIMQESVIYQDILQKGNKQGEERTIIRQLNRRFGEINSSLIDQIKLLPMEKLDTLAEALLDFSALSDLVAWLERNTSS